MTKRSRAFVSLVGMDYEPEELIAHLAAAHQCLPVLAYDIDTLQRMHAKDHEIHVKPMFTDLLLGLDHTHT